MEKLHHIPTVLCVISLLLSSCISPSIPIATSTATQITQPSLTPEQTQTYTLQPAPTLTATPQPEPTINFKATKITEAPQSPPIEWDLSPTFEKHIKVTYAGVEIKAGLVIDTSASSAIESVEIPDVVLAEIIAKTIYSFWLRRHYPETDTWSSWQKDQFDYLYSFDQFMKAWSKAQESGNSSDWRKVQLFDVWANDMTDGDGYVPGRYLFWPMYAGETPDGITALKEMTLAWVVPSKVKNLYLDRYLDTSMDAGRGYNFADGNLLIYYGHSFQENDCHEKWNMFHHASCVRETLLIDIGWGAYFLTNNYGGKPQECSLTWYSSSPTMLGYNNYLYRIAKEHMVVVTKFD